MEKFLFFFLLYLIGSIPFAFIVTKWRTGLDIRELGDGNIGAQNVWNCVGKMEGILVFLGDASKGFMAYWLAKTLFPGGEPYELAAVAVVLGHDFSLYLKGYGGKGMATIIGFMLAYHPLATLGGILIWGLSMLFTRHFELSCAVGWATVPIQIWRIYHQPSKALFSAVLFTSIGVKKLIDLPRERKLKGREGELGKGA